MVAGRNVRLHLLATVHGTVRAKPMVLESARPSHWLGCALRGEYCAMSIIAWIVLGLIAGWLAGQVMKGGGYGVIGDIVLGIIGAVVGGFLTGVLLGRDMV